MHGTTRPALPPPAAERLILICRLLGSDQPGERAAAALKAHQLVAAAGLDWSDLIEAPSRPKPPTGDALAAIRADFKLCEQERDSLTEWEVRFIDGIAGARTISEKQRATLAGIADRLRRQRARPATTSWSFNA